MLFNSYLFLFVFLPITYFSFRFFSYKHSKKAALISIVIFSMLFYMYWNPPYIFLLLLSVLYNFFLGKQIDKKIKYRKLVFYTGIVANLLLLFYFKYANFFINNVNAIFNNHIFNNFNNIIFPLGISFWTFQQISYLTDIYKKMPRDEAVARIEYFAKSAFMLDRKKGMTVNEFSKKLTKLIYNK